MTGPDLDQAYRNAWKRLQQAGIESAQSDARLLMGQVLGGGPEKVLAQKGRALTADEATHFEALVQRRLTREPMSQIRGRREFWSLDFKVTDATLTPRPDTETLIEALMDQAPISNPGASCKILDLGTGSGCILLALLSEWSNVKGVGVDASAEALAVAQENADTLGLKDRARFIRADWTQENWWRNLDGPFDVVVSNPPYIPHADIASLEKDVRDFEPHTALDGGADGLDAYRILCRAAHDLVIDGGLLAFEVGIAQANAVANLMIEAGFAVVDKRNDLGGITRAIVARK